MEYQDESHIYGSLVARHVGYSFEETEIEIAD
jgi:hypothetical protein